MLIYLGGSMVVPLYTESRAAAHTPQALAVFLMLLNTQVNRPFRPAVVACAALVGVVLAGFSLTRSLWFLLLLVSAIALLWWAEKRSGAPG